MKEYMIVFKSGKEVILTSGENDILLEGMRNTMGIKDVVYTFPDGTFIVHNELSHSYTIDDTNGSKIVRPPSPDELRAEAERKEQNRDVSLNAQLEGKV
jgi:hypothetical protein